ncbi:uncharacterized protein TRUGW13939_08765 [Talaromyces rugulosus]|uniref:Phenylalanine ammonia-lyase n=1 Tax=Talaromyces rugulosus TaxID=121627 RepID=A0A7H8RAG0_TALRU|nr:uncharacterized protein TRUGW13939_08765 [Talaromyces rugulosus]QKX61613.1 hypothetical protein TRUGW13939_08765 [Talaromyces rugulosus]
MASQSNHLVKVHELWKLLRQRTNEGSYELDGQHLHIAEVVATAQQSSIPYLSQDPKLHRLLQCSSDVLFDHLSKGWYVYGVNTGFGGSADSRTTEVILLQQSLMQLTQTGILSRSPDGLAVPGHSTPLGWVRAAMVVRCNSTLRGHSAVSIPTLKAMADLLQHRLTPIVPLRGSVSASGDLMPLAYAAGSLEGNPDILLEKNGKVQASHLALEEAGLQKISLGPKEGLSLVNGTSASAGLGALVVAESHFLALLTQFLTGGAVEALRGSSESFHPFIAQTRPHPGQIESARNIYYFLRGSHLSRDVLEPKNRRREDLVQDRYSLRSAPQWIGPQLEDLLLADQQISIELNSSCDNPLVDSEANEIYYGCNFQAATVTSAMEKVRLALQMFGRILFAQSSEMIDPNLSGGLPANLAADDPSLSFTMKGVDINMAAYMAELSYLANPLSSHVQSAEMHNQSINSMALASARMSFDAIDILTKMSACSVYVVCQALDLRCLHTKFLTEAVKSIAFVTTSLFSTTLDSQQLDSLLVALKTHTDTAWAASSKSDLQVRCELLVSSAVPIVVAHAKGAVAEVVEWKEQTTSAVSETWKTTYKTFADAPPTAQYLGNGSGVLYEFVRNKLGVPFHEGFVEHPTADNNTLRGRPKKTIGGWISIIHDSIEDHSIYDELLTLVEKGILASENEKSRTNGVH